jgi:hypothetical protein
LLQNIAWSMSRFLVLFISFGLLACALPEAPSVAARPGPTDGTLYVLAGGAVLKCNTWGFDTVCR